MADNAFHLKWNNHLQNMYSQLETLYNEQSLVDVSISCTDGILKAHRIVLSACSPYFESIFRDNYCKHPVLILKGVTSQEMQALLKFMYKGSVEVLDADLQSFMYTANELKIRGLADELLKQTIRLVAEKGVSSDVENKDSVGVENSGHIDDVKITDVRTPDIIEDQVEKCNKSIPREDIKENTRRASESQNNDISSKQLETSAIEKPSLKQNSSETNSMKATAPPVPLSYTRETRFKGRKRVSVGFLPSSRTKSTEKQLSENKSVSSENTVKKIMVTTKDEAHPEAQRTGKRLGISLENGKQAETGSSGKNFRKDVKPEMISLGTVEIKEEVQEMDMFCISALAEQSASPDPADDAEDTEADDIKEEWNTDTVCAFCCLDCHSSTELKKHLRVHTGEKPHECDLCELAFARASHLARHRRVHTGERPFTCSGCGRSFSRQDKLKQHARRHHVAEPPKTHSFRIDKPRRPRGRPPKHEQ
ncbi:zinc finger and SCAN domain-containing protein 10-like isoform X3 [Zootermopsis nevadensis]|uniref:zinc finger and SCAN domain-containing protein 10-like isoform X3 n=1 Tax=Zootermopsis nevadensis TaxID=136037 RepID=UPI000B8EAAD6|nr:zinc finger and SCAN domain-containing protein 10-like isoform X3 [Zootermopsis nevadensis]